MGGCTSRNTGTEVQQAVQPRPVPRSGAAAPASASSPRPASPVGAVAVEISAPLVFAQPTRVDREHQAAEQAAACDQSLDASMLIVPDDDMEASSPGTMPLLDAQPQPQPQPQRSTFRPVQAIVRGSARGGSAAGPTTTTARFPSSTISSVSPTPPVRTGAEQMRVQMALWGTQAEDVGRGDSDHARHGATSLQAAQISAGARRDRRLGGVVPGGMAHVAPVSRNASREAGSMAGRRPDAGPGRGLMPDRPAGRQYTAPHAAHQEATVRQGSCITPPSPITDLSGPDAIQDTLDTLLRLEQQLLGDELGAVVPGEHDQNAALSSGGPATPLRPRNRAGRVAAAATELAEPELSPLFPIFQTKGTAGGEPGRRSRPRQLLPEVIRMDLPSAAHRKRVLAPLDMNSRRGATGAAGGAEGSKGKGKGGGVGEGVVSIATSLPAQRPQAVGGRRGGGTKQAGRRAGAPLSSSSGDLLDAASFASFLDKQAEQLLLRA